MQYSQPACGNKKLHPQNTSLVIANLNPDLQQSESPLSSCWIARRDIFRQLSGSGTSGYPQNNFHFFAHRQKRSPLQNSSGTSRNISHKIVGKQERPVCLGNEYDLPRKPGNRSPLKGDFFWGGELIRRNHFYVRRRPPLVPPVPRVGTGSTRDDRVRFAGSAIVIAIWGAVAAGAKPPGASVILRISTD